MHETVFREKIPTLRKIEDRARLKTSSESLVLTSTSPALFLPQNHGIMSVDVRLEIKQLA